MMRAALFVTAAVVAGLGTAAAAPAVDISVEVKHTYVDGDSVDSFDYKGGDEMTIDVRMAGGDASTKLWYTLVQVDDDLKHRCTG